MAAFKNKYQMIKASDDEIREFFATTIFEGIFSKEVKSTHAEYFKGSIHSIKINGERTNVIGSYINVPISANDIPEGECTFKCRVKEEVRKSPCDCVLAFWDGKSRGTKFTIDYARQMDKPIKIVNYLTGEENIIK